MTTPPVPGSDNELQWREILMHGPRGLLTHGPLGYKVMRWVLRRLPSELRCKNCYVPFSGISGGMLRFFGFGPSRKNPRMCDF